jgi:hypothetical protein
MPFGLKNTGMTFEHLMDRLFFDMPFLIVFLDDLLVASRLAEELPCLTWAPLCSSGGPAANGGCWVSTGKSCPEFLSPSRIGNGGSCQPLPSSLLTFGT